MKKKNISTVTNDSTKVIVLDPKRAVAILYMGSLAYYKTQQGLVQQRLTIYYSFESQNSLFKE